MKKIRFLLLLFTTILFCQCKPSQQILRYIKKEHDIECDKPFFDKARKLMISKLPRNVCNNDTIIIMERYLTSPCPSPFYSFRLYESQKKTLRYFDNVISLINGNIHLDSLEEARPFPCDFYHLNMILNNQLDELKRRGDNSKLFPQSIFLVHILTKKGKKKFAIKTVKTRYFVPEER